MNIVSKGNQGFGFEGPWKCTFCDCKWELHSTDRKTKFFYDDKDGDYHSMECPECKEIVYRNSMKKDDLS